MDLGERPKTVVQRSMRIEMKSNGWQFSNKEEREADRREFDLYYDGIELHSSNESGSWHVRVCDDNNGVDVFDEYGDCFEDLMERAMQGLSRHRVLLLKSAKGAEKAGSMLAQMFLEGGVELTDEEKVRMDDERKMDGNDNALERAFDEFWN